jgi:CheY-like chemotaxis protein
MNHDPNILYVEDDALSREVMEALLTRKMGLQKITIFKDSTQFMDRLRAMTSGPDVIFLDIHMEPIDGFEMLRQVREDGDFEGTKIVALTASVMNEEVKMLRAAGFNGVLAKPLDVDAFPGALDRILSGEQVWIIK